MTTDSVQGEEKLRKAIQWASTYLLSMGYLLRSPLPEKVQDLPWSHILRFETFDGYIYLKQTPKLLALECHIIQTLDEQFHAPVPQIIAHNVELDCFLMSDAGTSLREILKKHLDVSLLCETINLFSSMQLTVDDHINIFLEMGVPDWRLDKLPELYQQLLRSPVLIADGLSEIEINQLEEVLPQVSNLCQKLSSYSIKPSIVQPDFNDNNVLINNVSQKMVIIDLGEIVISHPFFSLVNFLQQMKKHYGLVEKDKAYQQIFEACLKNFSSFESQQNLLDAFTLAQKLWFVYEALAHYRLMMACDKEKLKLVYGWGKLSKQLKSFMHAI